MGAEPSSSPRACVGAPAGVPGGPTLLEYLLDKGLTDVKESGNGALRAEPLITGPENLLLQVHGIGFHAYAPHRLLPYANQELL
jgi:hypothetical protein